MSERRSNRQRRVVNYRQVLDNESGLSDDDDFADLPPSKKTKVQNSSSSKRKEEAKSSKRLSRDEKMYNKALEQALKESQASGGPVTDVDDDFAPDIDNVGSLSEEEGYSDDSEDGDFHSAPPPKSVSTKKQKTTTKKARTTTSRPEHREATASQSLEKSPKSDCTVSSKNLSASGQSPNKANTPPEYSSVLVKPPSVDTKTPQKSMIQRPPKWTPPSHVSKGTVNDIKPRACSSGSPLVRVGLSRHAKVKPLHVHGNRTS